MSWHVTLWYSATVDSTKPILWSVLSYLILADSLAPLLSISYATHSLALNLYFIHASSGLVKMLNVAWTSKGSHCHCWFVIFSSYFFFIALPSLWFLEQQVLFFPLAITQWVKTDILGLGWCCPFSSFYKQSTIVDGTQNHVTFPRTSSAERTDRK